VLSFDIACTLYSALVELLKDSNDLSLEISEIEGNAILFFKFGDMPDLDSIYKQLRKCFQIA
jgi:hypothetical protein